MNTHDGSNRRSILRPGSRLRPWIWAGGVIVLIIALAYGATLFVNEPLRRYTEAKMNRAMKGYTVHIAGLQFHPVNFALNLKGLTVSQNARPNQPILEIPYLHASVHWKALLLHGRVVGDMLIARPKVYMNLPQMRKEIANPTPVKERGWQEAFEAIYPLKINVFRIREGDITYQDQGPFKPLHIEHFNFHATNIRNVRSREHVYPSEFQASAVVFGNGHLSVDGRADFLAEPNATFIADTTLDRIALDYFKPITDRYNVTVDKGVLSAKGQVEYGAKVRRVELREATIDGIKVDYVHTASTANAEQTRVTQTVQAAQATGNAPDLLIRIGRLHIRNSNFGYVNRGTNPPYRVFLADTDITVTNVSNQTGAGIGTAALSGKFMDSGTATVDVKSRSTNSGPAFDVAIRIAGVDMSAMSDLFRAYGNFDVASGQFAFYSEVSVEHGAVTGYVKPMFKDISVYAPPGEDTSLRHKIYVKIVGVASKILKNRTRKEVATRADVNGRLDNPKVSVMQVAVRLVQNAFFKAILPGLERETTEAREKG